VIAALLCGQIKFKRMTRTLVSRAEQWPFEHTSLEDLSRRLLTLRCTVDGTMENCADARRRRREVVRSPWFGKYRGIEIDGRQLLLLSLQPYGTELKPNLALFLVLEIPASSNRGPSRSRAPLLSTHLA